MQVIGTLFFFICISFIIMIFAVILLAVYLKNKMAVFKEVQAENESYHHEPYKDADFYSIGHDEVEPVEIVDAEYRVLPEENETDGGLE